MYHQDAVIHLHFYLLLKKATAVAETSNTTFLASVNFLIFFIFTVHGITCLVYCYILKDLLIFFYGKIDDEQSYLQHVVLVFVLSVFAPGSKIRCTPASE